MKTKNKLLSIITVVKNDAINIEKLLNQYPAKKIY